MKALLKNTQVLATGLNQEELLPMQIELGGDIVDVIPLAMPADHVRDGQVQYVVEGNVVRQVAKTKYAYSDYAEARRQFYPPIVDYLDGIVKNDQAQIQNYIDKCLAVKARFPKPQNGG